MRALSLLSFLACGCSWMSMTSPPDPPVPDKLPVCTRSRVAPALDLLLALPASLVVGGVTWAAAGGKLIGEDDSDGASVAGMFAAIITGGVLVGSAITGFGTASACRAAQAGYYDSTPAPRAPRGPGPDNQGGPSPGTERGVCLPDGTCAPGLTCASGYCVRLR